MNGKAIIVLASLLTYCPALAARPKTVGYLPVKPLTVALQATYALARGRAATETFCRRHGIATQHWVDFRGMVALDDRQLNSQVANYVLTRMRDKATLSVRRQAELQQALLAIAEDTVFERSAQSFLRDHRVSGWPAAYDAQRHVAAYAIKLLNPKRAPYIGAGSLRKITDLFSQLAADQDQKLLLMARVNDGSRLGKSVPVYRVRALKLLSEALNKLPQRTIERLVGSTDGLSEQLLVE